MLLSDILTAIPGFYVIGDNEGPGSGSYDTANSSETLLFGCPYASEELAIQMIMGYSKKNLSYPGTGNQTPLTRVAPLVHPRKPRLSASRIATTPWKPKDGDGVWIGSDANGLVAGTYGPYPGYLETKMTVTFQGLPYYAYSDTFLNVEASNRESRRWTRKTSEIITENIQLRQGEMFYHTSAPGIGLNVLPPIRPTISNKMYAWTITWYDVPDNVLFNSSGKATAIDSCLNKVNSSIFLGAPAGTLLFHNVKWTERQAPVDASVIGVGNVDDIPRYWDVTMSMLEFDPPTPAGAVFPNRGHNLGRHPTNGYYYLLVRDPTRASSAETIVIGGLTVPNVLFASADFENAFLPAS